MKKSVGRRIAGLAGWLTRTAVAVAAIGTSACRDRPPFDYDFESAAIVDDLAWKCRTIYRLSRDHATSGAQSLEMVLYPAPPDVRENYPGISLEGFDPDWSRHRAMKFDVHNQERSTVRLAVRIDDRENPEYADRFNRAYGLAPGDNQVAIPFEDLVTSGTRRPLDIRGIRQVILFTSNPTVRQTVFLDNVRLE